MLEYKIVVYTYPHVHEHPDKPFFWYITGFNMNSIDTEWTTESQRASGWAASPTQAFRDALKYLNDMSEVAE